MNRLISLVASAAVVLALGGCHRDYNDTGDNNANPSTSSSTSPATNPNDNGMPPARSSTTGQPGNPGSTNQPAPTSTPPSQQP
jgi:hypothetical protein